MAGQARSVGVCDRCCGPVLLQLSGVRRASCACGATVVSAQVFAANAAMADRLVSESIDVPGRWQQVPMESWGEAWRTV